MIDIKLISKKEKKIKMKENHNQNKVSSRNKGIKEIINLKSAFKKIHTYIYLRTV